MSRLRLSKIAAPSAPPASTLELFYSSADSKLEAIDESGNLAVLAGFAAKDYRLIRILNFTTTQSPYTPTPGTRALFFETMGGGGGGGGVTGGTSACAVGGGGGGGAYANRWLSGTQVTGESGYTVTIGGGGSGGTTAPAAGGNGTDTTIVGVTSSTSYVVAKAGQGGSSMTSGTAVAAAAGGISGAAASCTGDLTLNGASGIPSLRQSATQAYVGAGGAGLFGSNAFSYTGAWLVGSSFAAAGSNGTTGGGGGGGYSQNNAAASAGGTGGSGWCRVWEFA